MSSKKSKKEKRGWFGGGERKEPKKIKGWFGRKNLEQEKNKTEKEKLEERREEVLAKGRKFKYPLQQTKYQIVGVALLLSLVLVLIFSGVIYVALYHRQSTSDILFKLTQVLPVSVAEVEGEKVKYGDYLLIYRSSIFPVLKQEKEAGDLNKVERDYKKAALDLAIEYTYALKLAKDLNVKIGKKEIEEAKALHRKVGGVERSEEGLNKVVKENFGLTKKEYERLLFLALSRKEVARKVDEEAEKVMGEVMTKIKEKNGKMRLVAEAMGEKVQYEETGGLVDDTNLDGGRAIFASKLKEGEVSEPFIESNGEGIYVVKLIKKMNRKIDYQSIKVPLRELNNRVAKLRAENKVKESFRL